VAINHPIPRGVWDRTWHMGEHEQSGHSRSLCRHPRSDNSCIRLNFFLQRIGRYNYHYEMIQYPLIISVIQCLITLFSLPLSGAIGYFSYSSMTRLEMGGLVMISSLFAIFSYLFSAHMHESRRSITQRAY
jgi:hypothetical protein